MWKKRRTYFLVYLLFSFPIWVTLMPQTITRFCLAIPTAWVCLLSFTFFFYFLISWSLSQKCGKDEQLFFRVSSFSFYFSHIANQEKIEYIHLLKKEYNLINFHIFSLLLLHSFIAILDKETDYQVYQVLRWTEIS